MTVETLVVIPCSYMPGRRPHPHKKQIHFQSHQTWPAGKSLHGIKVLMRKTSINQDFRLPGLNTGYKFNFYTDGTSQLWSDHRNPTVLSHVQHKELTQNRRMYPNLRPLKAIYIEGFNPWELGDVNFATTLHHFRLVHNDEIPVDELCLRMSLHPLHSPMFANSNPGPAVNGVNQRWHPEQYTWRFARHR